MHKIFTAATFAALMATQAIAADAPFAPWLEMTLASPSFQDGSIIPDKYTQIVPNFVSPALEWTKPPAGTASFALIMHDPDVALNKKGDDVTHWVAFNIPATAKGLPEGVPTTDRLADGTVQIKNIAGKVGYLGPGAPPNGPYHHYTFELYALDAKLNLGPEASRADVLAAMDGHILAKAINGGRARKK